MKALPILFVFLFSTILGIAQSAYINDTVQYSLVYDYPQTTRGSLSTHIPSKLAIHSPQPQIASDHCTLNIISPDYEEFQLKVFVHLEEIAVIEKTIWLVQGNKKFPFLCMN